MRCKIIRIQYVYHHLIHVIVFYNQFKLQSMQDENKGTHSIFFLNFKSLPSLN